MAIPALRQPKLSGKLQDFSQTVAEDYKNVVVTLKDNRKLVVSANAYQGIVKAREMFKCVFCGTDMELDEKYKDNHIDSASHKERLRAYPHMDEFGENLIRKLNNNIHYCTICNIVMASPFLMRHITGLSHTTELDKAMIRGTAYDV
ncbi:uncharacterized protein LOC128682301 [Plodia interpunctella]|uniref:uncharacterized protein LOC128682301 n=1 Tax=Plodia interpunctella TaxID=58824 RepID=UPI002368AAFD|nr:uncharacterized protein LOC128682301 [Plodia interpunctella]